MKCDKAQEFFSDYIETTLDRPMTVALEAHLGGCDECSADVAGLRSMWTVLDQVPQVEPSADFVWQTTTRLQNEFLNRQEAQRAKPLPWWKRLTPIQTFSYAGIAAALVVGLTVMKPGTTGGQTWNPFGGLFRTTPVAMSAPEFTLQPAGNGATLTIKATSDMPNARIWMGYETPRENTLVGRLAPQGNPRTLNVGEPTILAISPGGATAAKVRVLVNDQGVDRTFEKTVLLPGGAAVATSVRDAQPELALQQVAHVIGQPMLVDSGFAGKPVTLNLLSTPREQLLPTVLNQIGGKAVQQGSVLVITKQ